MEYVLGLLALAVGGWLFERSKRKTAEGVLSNNEVRKDLNEIGKEESKNDGLLLSEEQKRKELEEKLAKEKSDELSIKEMEDFFNKPKS